MNRSKDKGKRGVYQLTWSLFITIVVMTILLLLISALLIGILVIGVNTLNKVNADSVSSLLEAALKTDKVQQIITDALKQIDLSSLLGNALLGGSGGLDFGMKASPSLNEVEVKRGFASCPTITDETLCRLTRGTCNTLNTCIMTLNATICQNVGRQLIGVCTRL